MKNLDSTFSKATKVPNMVGKLDDFLILSDKSLSKSHWEALSHLSDFGMTGAVTQGTGCLS